MQLQQCSKVFAASLNLSISAQPLSACQSYAACTSKSEHRLAFSRFRAQILAKLDITSSKSTSGKPGSLRMKCFQFPELGKGHTHLYHGCGHYVVQMSVYPQKYKFGTDNFVFAARTNQMIPFPTTKQSS
jgi:hypothetical protein